MLIFFKSYAFAFRLLSFYRVKGMLLSPKRCPFADGCMIYMFCAGRIAGFKRL